MAKKSKSGKGFKKYLPAMLLAAGAAIVIFGQSLVSNLIEDFSNGIGVSISKVRFKFTGDLLSFNIPILNIPVKIPKYATWYIDAKIRNSNNIGGQVQGFDGWIKYGSGPDAVNIAPLKATPFNLAANSVATPTIQIDQELWTIPATAKQVVTQIRDGQYRKVFVSGKLRTNFGAVNIDQEVSLLSA